MLEKFSRRCEIYCGASDPFFQLAYDTTRLTERNLNKSKMCSILLLEFWTSVNIRRVTFAIRAGRHAGRCLNFAVFLDYLNPILDRSQTLSRRPVLSSGSCDRASLT